MTDNKTAVTVARGLKALADPTRLRIVRELVGGAKNVSELSRLLGVELVNMSHHLGVLRQADLLRDEKVGRFVIYRLDDTKFTVSPTWVVSLDLGWCRLDFPLPPAAAA